MVRGATVAALFAVLVATAHGQDPAAPAVATADTATTPSGAGATAGAGAPDKPAGNDPAAVELLGRIEQKNSSLKTLNATFTQIREDAYYGDTIFAEGEFWYRAPDVFRSTYKSKNPSDIWMVDGKLYHYVHDNRQVDVVTLPTGDDAPANQLLLGFGTKVDKILSIFDVQPAAEKRAGLVGIDFQSRDLSRSLEYESITIHFEEKSLEPRVIIARDPANVITVELKKIRTNEKLDDSRFALKWPDKVVVNEFE